MSRESDFDIIASKAKKPRFLTAPFSGKDGFVASPYQHAAVEYRTFRKHCLIGDEAGLGKTAEAIMFGNAIEAEYTLVVCPASLRLNWEREIRNWSTIENVTTYPVLKARDGISIQHNYVIISYSLLQNPNIMRALLSQFWDHLILDEAHALKNPEGNARTIPICTPNLLPAVCGRITMLSGTPMPNQPIEIYNACRLLDHSSIDMMSLDDFRAHYYEKEGKGYVAAKVRELNRNTGKMQTVERLVYNSIARNPPRNLDDLQFRLRKNIMVRRLKEDILDQLPPKRWHPFALETDLGIRKVMARKEWKSVEKLWELDPESFDRGVEMDEAVSTMLRVLGQAKAPQVCNYIEELLREGVEKILVGCIHVNTGEDGMGVVHNGNDTGLSVFDYITHRLKKYGLVSMQGSTSPKNRQAAVDTFQEDENIRIILGQLQPTGEGWTLHAASNAVFAEFWWVPGKNEQFLDRLHRRGQNNAVIGHVPLVQGTIDERVAGTVAWKEQNIHKALDAEL